MRHQFRTIVAVAMTAFTIAACRETGDVQVSSITFKGIQALKRDEIKAVIATQENGFLPWSRRHFFDRPEFDQDVKRIEAYYADRGYPNAKVVGVDAQLNSNKDKVAITVEISEGDPVLVENLSFEGLEALPADHVERLPDQLPIKSGNPRDQKLILAAHDMVVAELRDHGFPYGTVRVVERPGATPSRVQLRIVAAPGPKSVFGTITIEGDVSVDEDVIRRELAFKEGDLYELRRITESQRRIYGLELFQFANITSPSARGSRAASSRRRDCNRRQASTPPARGRLRIGRKSAWAHYLAPCEFRRRRTHWRDRGEGIIARAGSSRQLHRAVSVSAWTVDAVVRIDMVGP